MLYEGLSRINAQKLCQLHIQLCDKNNKLNQNTAMSLETFYNKHKVMINNTVFEDSYNSFHFWGFISESIKKSHANLPFILKNQYSNADQVYAKLADSVTNMKNNENGEGEGSSSFTQAIFDLPKNIMADFANDVYKYIILQPLYRHHIYSPIMCLLVLIDIMHSMADVYIHKSLGVEGKKKLTMYMDAPLTHDQILSIRWMSEIEKEMLSDECQVHAAQIKKNKKDKKK